MRLNRNVLKNTTLFYEFVKVPPTKPQMFPLVNAGQDQHWHTIAMRLGNRGSGIQYSRPRDNDTATWPSACPRETICHEGCALFMFRLHMADVCFWECSIVLHRMHTGYSEECVDAVGLKVCKHKIRDRFHGTPDQCVSSSEGSFASAFMAASAAIKPLRAAGSVDGYST